MTGADRRDRLEAFIHQNLARLARLQDLDAATGLRRSQLNRMSHEAFGCSPMGLVRRLRLAALRRALEADPERDLTQLSLRFGFDHQGRSAQYYRVEFGETPSQTRRLRDRAPMGGTG